MSKYMGDKQYAIIVTNKIKNAFPLINLQYFDDIKR